MNRRASTIAFLVVLLLVPALVLSASPNDEGDHYAFLPVIRTSGEAVDTWAMAYGYDETIRHLAGAVVESGDGGFVFGGTRDDTVNIFERDISIMKINSSGDIIWQKRFDGIVDDSFVDMDRTTDGKLIVAGSAIGGTTESRDVWFAKLDDDGSIIWQKLYGAGPNISYANDIQATADGGFVAVGDFGGYAHNDLWIAEFDSQGNVLWQKEYGRVTVLSAAIEEGRQGGYFVSGTWWSELSQELDVHVLRLDADGQVVWQKAFGESGNEHFFRSDSAEDGGLFITGLTATGTGWSDPRFWVMKVGKDGDVQWHKELIGEWDTIAAIRASPDGGCLVTGNTADGNMWLLKLNGHGAAIWQRLYRGTAWDQPGDLLLVSSGGYMLAGRTRSYGSGDLNAWLLKLDAAGSIADCSIDETLSPLLQEFSLPVRTPAVTGKAYTGTLYTGDLSSSDGGATRTVICPTGQANGAPAIGEGWAGRSTLCRRS